MTFLSRSSSPMQSTHSLVSAPLSWGNLSALPSVCLSVLDEGLPTPETFVPHIHTRSSPPFSILRLFGPERHGASTSEAEREEALRTEGRSSDQRDARLLLRAPEDGRAPRASWSQFLS